MDCNRILQEETRLLNLREPQVIVRQCGPATGLLTLLFQDFTQD
jgi:hypothetical protein